MDRVLRESIGRTPYTRDGLDSCCLGRCSPPDLVRGAARAYLVSCADDRPWPCGRTRRSGPAWGMCAGQANLIEAPFLASLSLRGGGWEDRCVRARRGAASSDRLGRTHSRTRWCFCGQARWRAPRAKTFSGRLDMGDRRSGVCARARRDLSADRASQSVAARSCDGGGMSRIDGCWCASSRVESEWCIERERLGEQKFGWTTHWCS